MAPVIVPFADWRPLPEATSQTKITPQTVIYHTAVGTLRGVENYFATRTGIESHLMVGGPWDGPDLDGAIWQWMDLERRADANLDANRFAISIETSDNHPQFPSQIEPWSPKQLASLVRLGNWLAARFDIPRRQCPAWDAPGFGWHAMWGAPSHWTPAAGKVCPGPARIHQLKTIVFPAIFAGHDLHEEEAEDMTDEQATQLQAIYDVLFRGHERQSIPIDNLYRHANLVHDALVVPGTTTAEQSFNMLFARVRTIEQQVQLLVEALGPEPTEPTS